MGKDPVIKFVSNQEWLEPLGEKSDAMLNGALQSVGEVGDAARDALVNSRLLGHTRHPTITDVPFGSWTVTLVSDILEVNGKEQFVPAADASLTLGLVASTVASIGGLADLAETYDPTERRLGTMHGLAQGVTLLLYGGSMAARHASNRKLGRVLSFLGYGTLIAASYFANELKERRSPPKSSQT